MIELSCARRLLTALLFSAIAACGFAQAQTTPGFQPQVGQPGKDVVWVPTPQLLVDKMLEMAKVTPRDYLIDLGSGDGRTVITAASRGIRALGIEYNPDMVALSKVNAAKAGVGDKATFVKADIFESDFSKATVITMFLLTDLNIKLRPTILSLRPGTRIVSNTFKMGEWEPDETAELACEAYCTAYLWIVPAKVDGAWQTPQGRLRLRQEFQKVTGTLESGGGDPLTFSDGRLRGNQLSFTVGGAEYAGRVGDRVIEGTVKSGGQSTAWNARR